MNRLFLLPSLILLLFSCNKQTEKQFEIINARSTGIDFVNEVIESDSLNIIIHNYIYNGAGVGVGDFNNDGLEDIFFAGNLVNNKLFLNKGEMTFADISENAGIEANGKWCSGVNVFDINEDGLLDIYVTSTYHSDENLRKNMLFINKGSSNDGIPIFEDQANQYGLDDSSYSTHSFSFDYDKDGDLDLYILNNKLDVAKTSGLNRKDRSGNTESNDRLYRNDQGHFTDVTLEANIKDFGFGLGIALIDANDDNWPDLYISNDFITNDILYINQQDGTFENKIDEYLSHQSYSSMGNDIADINNDGLVDIFTLDMLPRNDARMKMMFGGVNHYFYDIMVAKDYELEYARNVFQLNRGKGHFSDIGMISDLHNTDWSWSILMQDYTNNGLKDMFISNGFPRDITDLDFSDYHSGINVMFSVTDKLLSTIPQVKIPNIFVENQGNLQFKDVSAQWSDTIASYSNGAAFADLDNDGDLDIITSNINDPAFIYENQSNNKQNYLQVALDDQNPQINEVGTKVYCYAGGQKQLQILQPNRGYCSTSQNILHFGLGQFEIDSLKVIWPDGNIQIVEKVEINRKLKIIYDKGYTSQTKIDQQTLLSLVQNSPLADLIHNEKRFYDFDVQGLVQSLDSEKGPAVAIGDLDKNGTDDVIIGGNRDFPTQIAYQSTDGQFEMVELTQSNTDVAGIVIADINGDGNSDVFISQGSSERNNFDVYSNRLFINVDGRAFQEEEINASKSSGSSHVCAADFDKDGDMDIFVGGQSITAKFPMASKPQLLINENGKLTDHFDAYFDIPEKYFLSTSAIWTDVDNDSWLDLIVVSKWMPVSIYKNNKGQLFTRTEVPNSSGLWTSVIGSDLDLDGDIDYILGNQGRNNKFRIDAEHPIYLYAKDFDENGSLDLITSHFIDGKYKPYNLRNDLTKQLRSLSKVFKDYRSFSTASTDDILVTLDTSLMNIYKVETLESSILWNNGLDSLFLDPLPYSVQFSCVHGAIATDLNKDNLPDIISVGNDFGTEVFSGRTDAGMGSILLNEGESFQDIASSISDFYADGNTRGIASFKNARTGEQNFLVMRNNDTPLQYELHNDHQAVKLGDDVSRIKTVKQDGTVVYAEYYMGGGYLSQSTNYFFFDPSTTKDIFSIDAKGKETKIYPNEPL